MTTSPTRAPDCCVGPHSTCHQHVCSSPEAQNEGCSLLPPPHGSPAPSHECRKHCLGRTDNRTPLAQLALLLPRFLHHFCHLPRSKINHSVLQAALAPTCDSCKGPTKQLCQSQPANGTGHSHTAQVGMSDLICGF